jgi:hypothetical protein
MRSKGEDTNPLFLVACEMSLSHGKLVPSVNLGCANLLGMAPTKPLPFRPLGMPCVCLDHQTESGRVGAGCVHESVCPETNEVVEQPTSIKVACKMQKNRQHEGFGKMERGPSVVKLFFGVVSLLFRVVPAWSCPPPKSVNFTHMHKCRI